MWKRQGDAILSTALILFLSFGFANKNSLPHEEEIPNDIEINISKLILTLDSLHSDNINLVIEELEFELDMFAINLKQDFENSKKYTDEVNFLLEVIAEYRKEYPRKVGSHFLDELGIGKQGMQTVRSFHKSTADKAKRILEADSHVSP